MLGLRCSKRARALPVPKASLSGNVKLQVGVAASTVVVLEFVTA